MFKKWKMRRIKWKLAALHEKLAGREAALKELNRCGLSNCGIAEDIGVLKHRIGVLEKRLLEECRE